MNLKNKTAVVTGAARGQGLAEAKLLAEKGASVIICDVLEAEGREAANTLVSGGLDIRFARLDVALEDDWDRVADLVREQSDSLEILVNNAGIINRSSIADTSLEAWSRLMSINVTGAFLGIKKLAPLLGLRGGAVVNISSNSAFSAHYDPGYTASKWALRGLTRAAAMEFAGQKIRVNAVCPGLVLTDLNAEAPHLKPMIEMTPLKRAASVDEIAYLVAYLVSDEASFVTGEDFVIDGGFTAGAAYRRVSEEAGLQRDRDH
ncbi:cyclopentanol dehydrogenase [Devosia limi DSM 17137]|uniref:Cyclopentanol dehydrogenase n=1 Tax=Devosia limi DSM 17137 TaxID=1121477 RepID=A0A0F5LRW0_9HYPH|nr:SDR family oxidoreductase [Devosia limi]KKB84407.1 cyclopentanol dehydrogenase [Devosia limi DSM 17137]SHF61155.1 NAD(P)-dependent dehydrogenase, short-chain alcohol dehydrogenase family [Devosia limi DSM 17137]